MSRQDIQNDPEFIKNWSKLRDKRCEAFKSLDEKMIKEYMESCEVKPAESEKVFWKGVHMARAAMLDIPMELREQSIDWMIDNSTLFFFLSNNLTREEHKELLMNFYEVKYGNQLNS